MTLRSTTKEDAVSDRKSKLAVSGNGSSQVITIDSDFEEMDTETHISTDINSDIKTENDLGVIYISDHEYDSDYEYRRKTNRPGPKSKTRYKLSQDEKDKVKARYGNKRPRLSRKSAVNKNEKADIVDSSIKNDSYDHNSTDILAEGKAERKVPDGNGNSDQLGTHDIDISSTEDSNQMDESENKEEDCFTPKVKINSKETSANEDLSVTLDEENEKPEGFDKKDSKPHVHMIEETGILKTTCQENCDEKEKCSTPLGTDIDPKKILDKTIVKKDDTVMPSLDGNKIMNTDNLDNNADKEVIMDADIGPEEDLQKSAIVEEDPKNIS